MKLGNHLYLHGILKFNEMLKNKLLDKQGKDRLIIITELKEEIGSFRNKIADEINQYNNQPPNLKYLTGDIGMSVSLKFMNNKLEQNIHIQVCCSRCKLNNDYRHNDIFHPIEKINDFCIKGEDEGIFYLCERHDIPRYNRSEYLNLSNSKDEIFYQKIERYNLFGKS